MRPLPARKIIKILLTHGFILSRQKGSHLIFRHKQSGTIVPTPLHGQNKPLPIGTFLSIVAQSKIPKEKFEQ